jgi:hypothetical protein
MTLPPMANLVVDIEFSPKSQFSRYHFFFECLYIATVLLAARKSRTLELLAFDEYCRFDNSAFF